MTYDELATLDVQLAGRRRTLHFYPLRYEELTGYIKDRNERYHDEAWWLRAELQLVVQLDGKAIEPAVLDTLLGDPTQAARLIAARERLYTWFAEQGRVRAICPACGDATELDLAWYALSLHMRPWAIFDGLFLATPMLAIPSPPEVGEPYGERPVALRRIAPRPDQLARAARIDFELPSARCGVADPDDAATGTLGDIEYERERDAWRTYGPVGHRQPVDLVHWSYDEAWFRAALRLTVATRELRDRSGKALPLEPSRFTWLWLADVQFLDALYNATHDLPAQSDAAIVHCSNGHAFLPVR